MSATTGFGIQDVRAAAERIRGIADHTPLIPSPLMSKVSGHEFLMKMELMQPIGAF